MKWRIRSVTFDGAFHRRAERTHWRAACDWLGDDARPHPNHLATSLAEVNLMLALYESALRRAPVALPFTPEADLLPELRAALAHGRLMEARSPEATCDVSPRPESWEAQLDATRRI